MRAQTPKASQLPKPYMTSKGRSMEATPILNEYIKLLATGGLETERHQVAITEDDVLVAVDLQQASMKSQRYYVREVENVVRTTNSLLEKFHRIIATKDYHSRNNCSFTENGGTYDAYHVRGEADSRFNPDFKAKLREVLPHKDLHVVFKGIFDDTNSFGAFGYDEDYAGQRLAFSGQTCPLHHTGGFELDNFRPGQDLDGPSVDQPVESQQGLSTMEVIRPKEKDTIKPNLFVCGIVSDFCVLDTLVMAKKSGRFQEVYFVVDASRPAYEPLRGGEFQERYPQWQEPKYGSGFMLDPTQLARTLKDLGVKMIMSQEIV